MPSMVSSGKSGRTSPNTPSVTADATMPMAIASRASVAGRDGASSWRKPAKRLSIQLIAKDTSRITRSRRGSVCVPSHQTSIVYSSGIPKRKPPERPRMLSPSCRRQGPGSACIPCILLSARVSVSASIKRSPTLVQHPEHATCRHQRTGIDSPEHMAGKSRCQGVLWYYRAGPTRIQVDE